MSGSETLVVPEPVVDTQAAAVVAENAAYVYQRADGTIERAMSAEEAITGCPVLGRLAMEAPDQADALLALFVIGKEKMQAEERQQNAVPPEKVIVAQKLAPKTEAAQEIKQAKPPEPQQPPNSIYEQVLYEPEQAAEERIEPQRAGTFIHHQKQDQEQAAHQEKVPVSSPDAEHLPDARFSKASVQKSTLAEAPVLAVGAKIAASPNKVRLATAEAKAIVQVNESEISANAPVLPSAEVAKTKLTTELTDDVTPPVDLKAERIEAAKRLELYFEPQVVDAYKEPHAFTKNEITELDEPDESDESTAELDDIVSVFAAAIALHEEMQEEAEQDFETFLDSQSETREVISLATIIEQANEQPLEQTFVQLVWCLSDTLQETQAAAETSVNDMPELNDQHIEIELQAILQDIAEILPDCYGVKEETQEQCLQITPELSQKLLLLVRSLGYEQPKEVLIEFVRLHGAVFILQALQYMCQLSNMVERREFLVPAPISNLQVDEDTQLRLGKILFGLIMNKLGFDSVASGIKQVA